MQSQIKTKKIKRADLFSAPNMTTDEKKISFLNKYFIFKKIRDVNAEEVSRVMMNESQQQVEEEKKEEMKIQKDLIKKAGPTVRKIKKKLKIKSKVKPTVTSEENSNEEPKKSIAPAPGTEKKKSKKPKLKLKIKIKSKKDKN